MNKIKFLCEECGHYWEFEPAIEKDKKCPACGSEKIHRSEKHKRFAKKSRPKVRGLVRTR